MRLNEIVKRPDTIDEYIHYLTQMREYADDPKALDYFGMIWPTKVIDDVIQVLQNLQTFLTDYKSIPVNPFDTDSRIVSGPGTTTTPEEIEHILNQTSFDGSYVQRVLQNVALEPGGSEYDVNWSDQATLVVNFKTKPYKSGHIFSIVVLVQGEYENHDVFVEMKFQYRENPNATVYIDGEKVPVKGAIKKFNQLN